MYKIRKLDAETCRKYFEELSVFYYNNSIVGSCEYGFTMEKAKEKLLNSNYAIQQIANITGYTDAFTFSKAFKRYTGLSPKYYREKH